VVSLDNVVIGKDQFGGLIVQEYDHIARVGQSSMADFDTTYTISGINPNSIEMNISRTVVPPNPSYSGTLRAAAVVKFTQSFAYQG